MRFRLGDGRFFVAGVLAFGLAHLWSAEPTAVSRRELALAEMLRLFPKSPAWEQWLRETRELPPDFDQLPTIPFLPDALQRRDGTMVRTPEQWPARRAELLELFAHYVFGRVPPPPGNVRVAERQTREEPGAVVEELVLEFGPEHRARLHAEILRPPGPGPFPVFLTQDNHRRWAAIAVSRGYLACVYAGADSRDDTGGFVPLWPGYDWTKLARRAWAASRCVDYLVTRPEVDPRRIALTGHSRNGKLSLIAAALDERIAAVISSSSGAGGACSYRLFSEAEFGEGIELLTRHFPDWLHPRLRFFAGREAKLPIDQHELIACIAPRPCLLSSALNDNVESVWAVEHTWRAARPVYALWGAEDALNLRYRPGAHPTGAGDLEAYLDWLDVQFGRSSARVADAPIYPTYEDWLRHSGERVDPQDFPERGLEDLLAPADAEPVRTPEAWAARKAELRRRLTWTLGDAPPLVPSPAGAYGAESSPVAQMLGRSHVPPGVVKQGLSFGSYLAGDLYLPASGADGDRKLPAMIWVHPISVSNGYVAGYRRGEAPHLALLRGGCAVFAFDQIGHGTRLGEATRFYARYPRWSLLGKTVQDLRAAVDALEQHPRIDAAQIFLIGYATGAMAALHAAALDERVAGVLSVAGFAPMRLDTPEKGTGGVARWAQWWPWIPRLGAFVGHESRIPYDYPELLALIAPRPVQVIVPRIDLRATRAEVDRGFEAARRVYAWLGAEAALAFKELDDYHRFAPDAIFCLCGDDRPPPR